MFTMFVTIIFHVLQSSPRCLPHILPQNFPYLNKFVYPKKHMYIYYILVGGAITILKNMKVNGKDDIPFFIMENKSYVPNHQPVYITIYYHLWYY